MFLISKILSFLIIVVPVLISVAYLTLAERKIMAAMQQRTGPNVVGFLGLLQPLADGLKLLLKETVIPTNANTFGFVFAPVLTLFLSLFG
jgi:NADH:ubiquinone oxidoreductase subunit H